MENNQDITRRCRRRGHPTFRGLQRTPPTVGWESNAREPKAEHLLTETERRALQLLNEEGVPTYRKAGRESVIDLAFATSNIAQRTLRYLPRPDWTIKEDHFPIEIRIDLSLPKKLKNQRFALKSANWERIISQVQRTEWKTNNHGGINTQTPADDK